MANALEAASLVMIPSGYEDGTLGSLKPTDGSGDFTFSRGSNLSATRINEQGYIEKGYENLLLQSNSFLTTWITSGQMLTPVGGQSGYDGTNDAWKIQRSDTTAQNIKQNVSQSGVQTFSVYAKKGNVDYISLISVGGAVTKAIFSLPADGSGTNTLLDSDNISASIEYISEGWYRVSATFNQPITDIRIYPSETASTEGGSVSDAFIYIQDAMLNQGLVAYPYIETTTAPVAGGILEDMPRLDWSGSCPSLLLEPSRTNVLSHSEYLNGISWAGQVDITFTPNYGISPEGVKNSTRIQFADDTAYAYLSATITTNAVASVYVKGTSGETFRFGLANNAASGGLLHTFSGEWERISNTKNTNGQLIISSYGGTALDFEAYGLQLEQDATYPTSYIPTYGVSQTRLRDNARISSAAGVIGQSAGTIFADFIPTKSFGAQLIEIANGSTDRIFTKDQINGAFRFDINANKSQVVDYTSPTGLITEGQSNKFAITYSASGYALYINGSKITSANDSVVFNSDIDALYLAQTYSGQNINDFKTNNVILFPTALSDSECIALTTI